jgi:hypothetical protein
MHEFDADLLLGGVRLKHVHGELAGDQPLDGTADHLLSGRLSVDPALKTQLEIGRRYRLAITDGPAGPVVVSRIDDLDQHEVVIEFEPSTAEAPKPR